MDMKHKHKIDESGMVSLIVTMVLMIVVTLIVIGFSQIARREQRQALDRQLSTQAYYAAESGINDAMGAIKNGYTADKNDCVAVSPFTDVKADLGNGVSYSCLLIDQSPNTLEYTDIDTAKSTYARFSSTTANIETLEIWWQGTNDSTTFATSYPNFPPAGSWPAGGTPVLRATVTAVTSYNRNALDGNTYTAFLYPNTGASSTLAAGGPATSGAIGQGGCSSGNTPKYCHVSISLSAAAPEVFLQLKSIYGSSKVTIIARDSSSSQLELKGAQTLVDATGKATDVLRRIQVRVPSTSSYDYPPSAVYSVQGVCKRLNVIPGVGGTSVASGSPAICNP